MRSRPSTLRDFMVDRGVWLLASVALLIGAGAGRVAQGVLNPSGRFAARSLDRLRWIGTCPSNVGGRSIGRGNLLIQQPQIHGELSAVMAGV